MRLGITAPDDVAIHRSEIYQQIGNVRPVPPAELVEAWNREHPAPALIEYRPYRGAEPQRTRTVGRASVSLGAPSDTLARPTVRVRCGSAPRYGRYSISAGAGCSRFQASTSSAGGTGRTLPICW